MKILFSFGFMMVMTSLSYAANYPVYPGCASPATSYKRVIILDGARKEYLSDFLASGQLKPGDHVIVKGRQGNFVTKTGGYPALETSTEWIKIEGQGAIFNKIDIRGLQKILIHNVTVSDKSTSPRLVSVTGGRDVIFADSKLLSVQYSSKFTVDDWLTVPMGILSDNTKCVSILRNSLLNLRHGIFVTTRGQVSQETIVNGLVQGNELRNISGDFLRPLGSNISLIGNKGFDGYVSLEDGDGNHDDFIQGYALPLGIDYKNVKIYNNEFVENTNYFRKFKSSYQGIVIFDGLYSKFHIKNNKVLGSAYHGINIKWGKDGIIENNTVLSISDLRRHWIYVSLSKQGDLSSNIQIRNNISNAVLVAAGNEVGTVMQNNFSMAYGAMGLNFVAFNIIKSTYNLTLLPTSAAYNKNAGALP